MLRRALLIVLTAAAGPAGASPRAAAGLQSTLRAIALAEHNRLFAPPSLYGQPLISEAEQVIPALRYNPADGEIALRAPALTAGLFLKFGAYQPLAGLEVTDPQYYDSNRFAPVVWFDLESVEIRLHGLQFGTSVYVESGPKFLLPDAQVQAATSSSNAPSGALPEISGDRFAWQLSFPSAPSPTALLGADIRLGSALSPGLDRAALSSALDGDSCGGFATYRWNVGVYQGAVVQKLAIQIVAEPLSASQVLTAGFFLGFLGCFRPAVAQRYRAVKYRFARL